MEIARSPSGCSCTMVGVDEVRVKYEHLRRVMDERVTRLWAAAEAEALGYGGVAAVRAATGIIESRIRAGLRDLAEQAVDPDGACALPEGPASGSGQTAADADGPDAGE